MAIAFDAVSESSVGTASTLSWSHTCTGSDRLLVVASGTRDDQAITGVTYNGVALTKIRHDAGADSAPKRTELWYLVAPATGANTIEITYAGSPDTWNVGAGISLTGVDQSSPVDANNGATGSGTGVSVSVTTVADNAWVLDAMAHLGNTASVGAGQTARSQREGISASSDAFGASTEGPKTPAGAVTMSWTSDAAVGWAISAASFKPATGGIAITVVSAEHGFDLGSVDFTQLHVLGILSSEYGFEGSVARFLKNIVTLGSEYGVEVGSSQLIKNLVIASLESGYELGSSAFSANLIAAASDYGIDIQSVAITVPASGATVEVLVSHSEYGWEIQSTFLRFFKRGGTHALRTAAVAVDSRKSIVGPDVRRRTPGGLN